MVDTLGKEVRESKDVSERRGWRDSGFVAEREREKALGAVRGMVTVVGRFVAFEVEGNPFFQAVCLMEGWVGMDFGFG